MKTIKLLSALSLALVACGGSQKSGLNSGGKDVPPPPTIASNVPPPPSGGGSAAPAPKRDLSADVKKDYQAALATFLQTDKDHSWNESACRSSADKFSSVAHQRNDLVEAQFMVGLSYERCGLNSDAEKAYQAAAQMKGDGAKIAMAVSSLGELYFRAGKVDGAKQYWDTALNATGKLVGAHIGLATLELQQMRKINNVKDANWKKLEEDARFHLSSGLAVDTDSVEAYTMYGLVYMEGWQQNKNRLDLAKTLLDEGKKRNEKYAPLQNAYGLWYMHKNQINQALTAFSAAVDADPKFVEARRNAGMILLGSRKYDAAKEMLSKVVELAPKDYDALNGLGFAQRGLNDLDGAEATYKKAIQLDGRRGEAYYNLGVLYKGFRANHQNDLQASIKTYDQAKQYFQQFMDKEGDPNDKAEAKNNIADCDKVTKQLEAVIKAQANMPPPPPTPPAAPAGGGSGSGSGGGQ
jgi:tetratricopeptide (TPR) repeat protein